MVLKSIKNNIRKLYLKRKYKNKNINSPYISLKANINSLSIITDNVYIGPNSQIGAHTYVNSGTYIFSGEIGKYCSIAYNVIIGPDEHPLYSLSTSPSLYINYKQKKEPPIIMNDVWIGANAVILRGVKIGNGAVIGANSLVTKDVEPYSIVGGVPAKLIKYRFDEDTINTLLELNWWDKNKEEISELNKTFQNEY